MLSGSAWSTEKIHEKIQRKVRYLFWGIKHRLKKEEMEEQFNSEAKEGWRCAADAAQKFPWI